MKCEVRISKLPAETSEKGRKQPLSQTIVGTGTGTTEPPLTRDLASRMQQQFATALSDVEECNSQTASAPSCDICNSQGNIQCCGAKIIYFHRKKCRSKIS